MYTSLRISFNHGVYESETPPLEVLNGTFARFQKDAFASGEVANARSPIPAARASGDILKKGTAVVTTLIDPSLWAMVVWAIPERMRIIAVSLNTVGLISKSLCYL